MAKFRTAITAAALFCLFAVSLAGNQPENDEATTQLSLPLPEAANHALRFPTEPANTETDSNSATVSAMPLTRIKFRPINRRLPVRSRRPCLHHFKFYPVVRENEEIPYGNDMIVASGENSDFQEAALHGGGRRIPGRWVRLHHRHHHHDDEDSDSDDEDEDRMKKIVFRKYDYDRFDREKRLKKLRKRFGNEEEEKKKKGGFMKRVRKFLDQYF